MRHAHGCVAGSKEVLATSSDQLVTSSRCCCNSNLHAQTAMSANVFSVGHGITMFLTCTTRSAAEARNQTSMLIATCQQPVLHQRANERNHDDSDVEHDTSACGTIESILFSDYWESSVARVIQQQTATVSTFMQNTICEHLYGRG